jgi:hypothetical protein
VSHTDEMKATPRLVLRITPTLVLLLGVAVLLVGLALWFLLLFHVRVFLWVTLASWGLALVTGVTLRVCGWRQRRRKERDRIPRAVGRMRT